MATRNDGSEQAVSAGGLAGGQSGAQAGAGAGTKAEAEAGAQAEGTTGAEPGTQAGAKTEAQVGVQARAGAQAGADMSAQARAGAEPGAEVGVNTGKQAGTQAGPGVGLVVWDFDGVLNANIRDGRFVWADDLGPDLGIDAAAFSDFVFASGRMRDVVSGRIDLLDVVGPWLAEQGHAIAAADFLDYWWRKDAHPDAQVLSWLDALAQGAGHGGTLRQVIGTNNEGHRATYIEGTMGFAGRVERVFASGRMGVAKPDAGFFEQISDWAGLAPEHILLIDDTARNIEAARALGWQAFHFTPQSRAALPGRLGLGDGTGPDDGAGPDIGMGPDNGTGPDDEKGPGGGTMSRPEAGRGNGMRPDDLTGPGDLTGAGHGTGPNGVTGQGHGRNEGQ